MEDVDARGDLALGMARGTLMAFNPPLLVMLMIYGWKLPL